MRMTKKRKIVLDIIKQSNKPLSAELIINKLSPKVMDPSTVYRSLELLFNNNYLLKSTLGQTTYYHPNIKDHKHYMQCLNCEKLFEVDCHLYKLKEQIEKNTNFSIISHNLTFFGYCENCNKNYVKFNEQLLITKKTSGFSR